MLVTDRAAQIINDTTSHLNGIEQRYF